MISVSVRQATSPQETAMRDTKGLRDGFLIDDLFAPGAVRLTYSHLDRIIVGGIVPAREALVLDAVAETGTPGFLDRREAAFVNIGQAGTIDCEGTIHRVPALSALYVGMGSGALVFASDDPDNPAQFYAISAPAHRTCPTVLVTADMARKIRLGSATDANDRTINQYVHPEVCDSCQLLVGITAFEPGSIWNTMPAHLHDRRSEVYLYFGMNDATRVFHFLGRPEETRHLVVQDRQAVLSPGWSIHSGAGTGRYSFVWAMAGDNKDFADMDLVPMQDLR
jgi:4-deoxy-L-threo-5-hexosulose-uronate ketol-isomerase